MFTRTVNLFGLILKDAWTQCCLLLTIQINLSRKYHRAVLLTLWNPNFCKRSNYHSFPKLMNWKISNMHIFISMWGRDLDFLVLPSLAYLLHFQVHLISAHWNVMFMFGLPQEELNTWILQMDNLHTPVLHTMHFSFHELGFSNGLPLWKCDRSLCNAPTLCLR